VRGASAQRKVVRSADGANAFSMEVGPYVSYASRDGVSAVFSGEVSSWPGVDMVQVTHDGARPALQLAAWLPTPAVIGAGGRCRHAAEATGSSRAREGVRWGSSARGLHGPVGVCGRV